MPVEESQRTARSFKPRWIWRALAFSIPLHLAVFAMLYAGGRYLVEGEMIRAHERDSQLLLLAAVNHLHLMMQNDSRDETRQRLAELAAAHHELRLHLWSAAGEPLPGGASDLPPPREANDVEAFLQALDDERFWLERADGGGPTLRGLVRIRADERCLPCHEAGATRGVASMTRDLGPEIRGQRSRLLRYLAAAVAVWGLLAAVVNRMTARAFERSAATVRAGLARRANHVTPDPAPPAAQILDPMSTALFESLRRSLEDQRRLEEDFASRLHHTDRLASLGRLAAGLAHEIKNPLAGIQGALEILRDESVDDSTRDIYGQMLAELGRVDSTIRALLRFARPAPTLRREVDVSALLEDLARFLGPGLLRRGIELRLEAAPGDLSFPLDAEQIRQVLVNLITNAAEAIEHEPGAGGGEITLRAARFPETGDLVLAVADNGPGIPEEDREQIFLPFFTSKFSGTGLGLAVTESLVTRHGGRIELESAPGEGSTFFIILPRPEGGGETRQGQES